MTHQHQRASGSIQDTVRAAQRCAERDRNDRVVSNDVTKMSEMPCHLIGDVHEGRNEVPTVPVRSPLKPPSGAKAREV
jgi:hypothetical protein